MPRRLCSFSFRHRPAPAAGNRFRRETAALRPLAAAVFASVAAAVFASVAACSVYDPSLVAATDAGADRTSPPTDLGRTDLRKPPRRPTIADSGDMEITFAMKDVLLSQGAMWSSIGYDLDDRNTTVDDPDTECTPPASEMLVFDGDDGIDNAFGQIIYPLVAAVRPTLQTEARAAQNAGRGTLLVRVRGWNGSNDDPRVDVTVAQSVCGTSARGIADVSVQPDGSCTARGSPLAPPLWGGDDTFFLRSDAFVGGTTPRISDNNAYVAGGTIVMRLPAGTEVLFFAEPGSVRVRFSEAIVTGQMSADRSRLEDVTVAGRWSLTELLVAGVGVGICESSSGFPLLKRTLDQRADLRAVPGSGGPGATCDAVSLGVRFEGYRAHWGSIVPAPEPPTAPCLP
jgi:hypothetical protein